MALKPDRIALPNGQRIKYFCNEVAERGIIVVLDTPGGEGMDDPNATVSIPASTGGAAAGILMNDVVNLDLTRTHRNAHKDEVQVGDKVSLLNDGFIRTNMVQSGDTPVVGQPAYWDADGEITVTAGSAQIGQFVSGLDAEGYVEIEINI